LSSARWWIACTALVFLSLEGMAFTRFFALLQVSVFTIGLGGGVLNGATNALVSDISSGGREAGLSFLGVFYGVGALGMPAVLGLLSKTLSQGAILEIIGAFVALVGVGLLTVRFPVPKQPQGFPLARGISLLRNGTLLLLGCILFFESGMEGVVNNWTTLFLLHKGSADPAGALFALSCLVGGLTFARLVLSRLFVLVSTWTVLFSGTAVIGIGTVLLLWSSAYAIALLGLTLIGIGFAPVFPAILGIVGDAFAGLSGTAFSIVLVIALIGNTGLNYCVGIIAHQYGIEQLPLVVLASLCAMVVLLAAAKRRISAFPSQHDT